MAGNESIPRRTVQIASPTILVVAYDPKFLKYVDMALKLEFECVVLSVTGGRSAVETAERVKPDLFILDYHRLDLGAQELSHRLHRIRNLKAFPPFSSTHLFTLGTNTKGTTPSSSRRHSRWQSCIPR